MKPNTHQGNFIVIYGINNLGKSTQAKLLVERLERMGEEAVYVKYPLYDFETAGPFINEYLREGNPHDFSPREFQILNILNRTQYQETLESMLSDGVHVVAEDYTGTGIAWGVGAGVDKDLLVRLNDNLLQEDVALLFDGQRFDDGREDGHTHEENDPLTEKVRQVHLDLADEFGWEIIDANRSVDEIAEDVWYKVESLF